MPTKHPEGMKNLDVCRKKNHKYPNTKSTMNMPRAGLIVKYDIPETAPLAIPMVPDTAPLDPKVYITLYMVLQEHQKDIAVSITYVSRSHHLILYQINDL